ncbi:DMT family transporter [Chromobacterium sp. Panama]|uniref:DMT family transporter n=1 Tax=Chromobacterium sp. Panama TaxID=2161826 RepID=UPI0018EEB6D9|nr:DMT family transporter [Chromobacterium sp. Panama]
MIGILVQSSALPIPRRSPMTAARRRPGGPKFVMAGKLIAYCASPPQLVAELERKSMSKLEPQHHRQGWEIALILVTALWGWSFVAIHDALNDLSDSAFNAYRFLIAALAMWIVARVKGSRFSRQDVFGGVAAGVALYLAFFFQTKGLAYTTASNASFITGLAVVFTPLFAYWLLKVRPEKRQLFGAATATIGLALLTLKNLAIHWGDMLVVLCAASFALHIVVLSKVSKTARVLNIAFVQVAVVGGLSLLQSLALNEFSLPFRSETMTAILIIALLGTAVGFYVQTRAQVASSPNRIALIIVLEPLFGGVFAYFLAGDRLSPLNLLGAGLIILGMLITEFHLKASRAGAD